MHIYSIMGTELVYHREFLVVDFSTIDCRLGNLIETGAPAKRNV